jgi:hypothetical protein
MGDGSHAKDGCTLLVIVMDKELKGHHEHSCGFGERQRLAHQPTEALAQRVVIAFHMRCFSRFFAHRAMLRAGDDCRIGRPKVAVTDCRPIGLRNAVPKAPTGRLAAVADNERDYLATLATQRDPDPFIISLTQDKSPEFIQF